MESTARAAQHYQAAQDSFERCDTDGFVSQWAHGMLGDEARLQAQIDERGGVWDFPALFSLAGERADAKLIKGRFGMCWAFLNPAGEFTGQFIAAFPKRESTMRAKGYYEGTEVAPAKATLVGSGRGLSGACSVRACVVRTDGK